MEFDKQLNELASGAVIIPALLNDFTQSEAVQKPDSDSWSALEVLCHLYDEECEDFRQRLNLILNHPTSEFPPIDPRGWVISRRYNQRSFSDMLQRWSAERVQSLTWLRSLSAVNWEVSVASPFGPFRAGDMLAAWVAHDNLHTRQLVELRRWRLVQLVKPYDPGYAGDW